MTTRAPAVLKIECFADKKFCHREHIVCPGTQHLPLYTHKEHTFYVFWGRPHKGTPRIIQSLNMYFGLFIPHGRCDQSSPPSIFLRPSASQPGTKIYTNERRNDPPAIKFCCCYINTVVRRLPLVQGSPEKILSHRARRLFFVSSGILVVFTAVPTPRRIRHAALPLTQYHHVSLV